MMLNERRVMPKCTMSLSPHVARVGEMAALDSCLRGISASLHKLTLVWRVRRVLARAIIAVALVERACARLTCQNK